MKKFLKAAILLSIPAAINYIIAKTANKRINDGFKEQTLKWKHGNVNYIVEGEGEPILLIHDIKNGFSLKEWKCHISELSKNYKVYAFDFIGFGHSEKPNINYIAYLYVLLINHFIKHVIKQKANVIASGKSCAYAILAYQFEPEQFNKIMLISPEGIESDLSFPENKHVFLRWLFESPLIGTTLYNIVSSKLYFKLCYNNLPLNPKSLCHSAHYGGIYGKMPFAANKSYFLNASITHVLPNVKVPLKIIFGAENLNKTKKSLKKIKKLNKIAQFVVFKNTKQYPHLERPVRFLEICNMFFNVHL